MDRLHLFSWYDHGQRLHQVPDGDQTVKPEDLTARHVQAALGHHPWSRAEGRSVGRARLRRGCGAAVPGALTESSVRQRRAALAQEADVRFGAAQLVAADAPVALQHTRRSHVCSLLQCQGLTFPARYSRCVSGS